MSTEGDSYLLEVSGPPASTQEPAPASLANPVTKDSSRLRNLRLMIQRSNDYPEPSVHQKFSRHARGLLKAYESMVAWSPEDRLTEASVAICKELSVLLDDVTSSSRLQTEKSRTLLVSHFKGGDIALHELIFKNIEKARAFHAFLNVPDLSDLVYMAPFFQCLIHHPEARFVPEMRTWSTSEKWQDFCYKILCGDVSYPQVKRVCRNSDADGRLIHHLELVESGQKYDFVLNAYDIGDCTCVKPPANLFEIEPYKVSSLQCNSRAPDL